MTDTKDLSRERIAEIRENTERTLDTWPITRAEQLSLLSMADRAADASHEQEAVELLRYQLRWSSLDWLAWGTKKRARQADRWIARELDSAPTRKKAKKR
jgi:hypothetical protein